MTHGDKMEVEINGKKFKLREPTFKLVAEIENETIGFKDGQPVLKVGIGHYKKIKLHKYIEEINGKPPTMQDIEKLHPSLATKLLLEIDKLEGGGADPFRAESN